MTESMIVIPARLASTRLPAKLLRTAGGKSILQHTYESASQATFTDKIVVAVDDLRLAEEVDSFGGQWLMTSPHCASGTDRIAEVARAMPGVKVFVNVQGDEPEIEPATIDLVAATLIASEQADMATIGTPIRELAILEDPACVKIVLARQNIDGRGGRAIYFSRNVVPHCRDGVTKETLAAEPPMFWHHIGLYAYRRSFLQWFSSQPPSPLEATEKLEQLRAIEGGKQIIVARIDQATPGIDTEADLNAFIARQTTKT